MMQPTDKQAAEIGFRLWSLAPDSRFTTLTVEEAAALPLGWQDSRRRLEVHGGFIYGLHVFLTGPPGVLPAFNTYRTFTLNVTTTVQWGQHADSAIASCKLNVCDKLRGFIERCDETANDYVALNHPGVGLKSSFYKDGWEVKAAPKYEGADLKLLRPGEAVRAQVRCGGLWVPGQAEGAAPDTASRMARLRWQLVELRRIEGA